MGSIRRAGFCGIVVCLVLAVLIVGVQGSTFVSHPSFSADGRYVAFDSEATDLVSGDTNAARDIFVRDRTAG